MEQNYYYRDEMEINLQDIMFYLLRKWRTLLIIIFLGAILGGGIYMVKSSAETEKIIDENHIVESYEIEEDIKANMELAHQYRILYEKQAEYSQSSIIMQLDPNQTYTGVLKYYISAGENTRLICEVLQNIINENELIDEIKSVINQGDKSQYVKELIACWTSREAEPPISINNVIDNSNENSVYDFETAVFYCTVMYGDETVCEKILQVIQDRVETINRDFQAELGKYEFLCLNNAVRHEINNDVLSKQKANADVLNTYLTNYTKVENTFDEKELKYYEAEYLKRSTDESETSTEKIDENGISIKETIKWTFIGVVLSCICWGTYYVIKYIFDKHIKNSEDFRHKYGLPLIGKIEKNSAEKCGLDAWIENLYEKSDAPGDSEEYIAQYICAIDKKNLILCGNMDDIDIVEIAEKLCDRCAKIKYEEFIHRAGNALVKAKDTDGIILLVHIGKTKYLEIKRELEVCRMQHISVEGVIVID